MFDNIDILPIGNIDMFSNQTLVEQYILIALGGGTDMRNNPKVHVYMHICDN